MQATQKSFDDLLKSASRFEIPEYQRPYCWTKEEVEQLWNDLTEAQRDQVSATPTEETGDEYFLGSIVVAKKRTDRGGFVASVVDGQQRLTTLHALFWCALPLLRESPAASELVERIERLLVTPARTASLAVAGDDQANFLALQQGSPLDETRALGMTGAFFRRSIIQVGGADALGSLLEFVLDQTRFIFVETDSYASAWDLFIGLNSKGRKLTPADLIKAFVCGNSADSNQMIGIWNDRVLPLEDDATSALLDITRVAIGDPGSEAKLFKVFERAWERRQITPSLLSDGALSYDRFWRAPESDVPGLSAARALRGLRTLDRRDHTVLVLALGARYGAEVPFQSALLCALEAYQLAMAVKSKRGRERDFTSLAAALYKEPPSERDAMRQIAALLRRLAPPLDEVRAAVASLSYPGRHMKFVVTQAEEGMRGDVRIANVQFEHLMPQKPTEFWYEAAGTRDTNDYARIVDSIGNIVPLDAKTNIAGYNYDWNKKRELYAKHVPNWLVNNIATRHENGWKPEHIRARAAELADWAVTKRWPLEEALQALEA